MTRVVAFLVSFLILFFLYFSLSSAISGGASAQELSIKEATESSNVKSEDKKVEYQLPYPGLLPDNPLYFLKALRDAVIDFLISDPLKKADFYLLAADKRLNAGVYLVNTKNKYDLAESTISKGENYFEKAIAKTKEAKTQGMDIEGIKNRLLVSSQKHQEVIMDLMTKNSKIKESFTTLLKRAENYEKQVELLATK